MPLWQNMFSPHVACCCKCLQLELMRSLLVGPSEYKLSWALNKVVYHVRLWFASIICFVLLGFVAFIVGTVGEALFVNLPFIYKLN